MPGPFLIATIIMTVISTVLTKMQADKAASKMKKLMAEMNKPYGKEIKGTSRSTVEPIYIIYGRHRVGANEVYVTTSGTDNTYLYQAHCLGEGTLSGIAADESGNPYIWFDGKRIHEEFPGTYQYDFKNGAADQTQDTVINTHNDGFTDTMRNVSYVAWRITYDENKFSGRPTIQYLVDGLIVYDFRTTVSGWSDNPAICLYDFCTNSRYGLGISSSRIDLDSWTEAADYCDTKNFKINGIFNMEETNAWDVVDKILLLFRGQINEYDGVYSLRFADLNEEASVLTIEDEDIFQDDNGQAQIRVMQPGRYDRPSGLKITYINADNQDYAQDSFTVGDQDGVVDSITYYGCTNKEMAGILGTSELERRQLDRTISVRLRDQSIMLEPYDVVTLNNTALALEDVVMRALTVSYASTGFVDLTLAYESGDIYNDVYDVIPSNIYSTFLPDPSEPSLIQNPAVEEETYDYRLTSYSRLSVTFDIPADSWFKEVLVWVSTEGDVTANYKQQLKATDDFVIDPVVENEIYYIVLQTVNQFGRKQAFEDASKLSITVIGQASTAPTSLGSLYAVPGNNSLKLFSTKLSDPDIESYEFRFGPQWVGGVFVGAFRSPNLVLDSIKPGFFEFTANTFGSNGLYGETPVYNTATIPLPKGYVYYDDIVDVAAAGSHDNTEVIVYDEDNYIKCSHTVVSGVPDLSGTYTSITTDIGEINAGLYFIYVASDFVTTGAATTWSGIAPSPNTWEYLGLTNTWNQVTAIDIAPRVNTTIQYKVNSGDEWIDIPLAEFTAAVVTLRYFRVVVTITDPSSEINLLVGELTTYLYE